MCGRYYVDDETAGEIEKLVRQMDERKSRESLQTVSRIATGISVREKMCRCCPEKRVPSPVDGSTGAFLAWKRKS